MYRIRGLTRHLRYFASISMLPVTSEYWTFRDPDYLVATVIRCVSSSSQISNSAQWLPCVVIFLSANRWEGTFWAVRTNSNDYHYPCSQSFLECWRWIPHDIAKVDKSNVLLFSTSMFRWLCRCQCLLTNLLGSLLFLPMESCQWYAHFLSHRIR